MLGLAPQASAAQELAAAIPGVDADTLDKLTHDLTAVTEDQWQPWMQAIGPDGATAKKEQAGGFGTVALAALLSDGA